MKKIFAILILVFVSCLDMVAAQSQCNQYSGRRKEDCLRAARAANQGGNSGASNTASTQAAAARAREERQRRITAAREEARREEARREARVAAARREANRRAAAARRTNNNTQNTANTVTQAPQTTDVPDAACTDAATIIDVFVPMDAKVGEEICFDLEGNGLVTWLIGESEEEKYGNTVCHTFAQTGAYTVKVIVDTECDTQQTARTVAVSVGGGNKPEAVIPSICNANNVPQIKAINLPSQTFSAGQAYTFTATVDVFDVESIYTWTIDGETQVGATATKTFAKAGNYPIRLKVENVCGSVENETLPISIRTNNAVELMGISFANIAPGGFVMGDNFFDDAPPHRVKITETYQISKQEVTQKQWQTVMGNNPSKNNRCGENCPVESVSYAEVQEFISKLNDLDFTHIYRLPTEAEWEFAARAGSNTTWYFGNAADQVCLNANVGQRVDFEAKPNTLAKVTCSAAANKTVEVGRLSANAFGLQDVYGNVAEWTQDCYDEFFYLQNTIDENPINFNCSGAQAIRVIRGGSWTKGATSSKRFYAPADTKDANIGFRLVRLSAE